MVAKLIRLIWRYALRNKRRTALTVSSAATSLFLLTTLAMVYRAMGTPYQGADTTPRMMVRRLSGIVYSMPSSYGDRIKNVPGVAAVSRMNWFGGYWVDPANQFANFAIDADTVFDVVGSATIPEEKESVAVIELGGSASWNVKGGGSGFGPTVELELTPIEKWLEVEAGVTPLFSRRSTEWGTDLLFKKPWTLSPKVEFMVGAGPEWIHTNEHGRTPNSMSGEAVIDVMFWHSKKHRFGWYVEPTYEYNFGRGHEQSLGLSGGLLIAIP